MIKGKCKYCDYELEKPRWEHVVYVIRKQGGDIRHNICPVCKREGLEIDWGEENDNWGDIKEN